MEDRIEEIVAKLVEERDALKKKKIESNDGGSALPSTDTPSTSKGQFKKVLQPKE